MVHRNVSPRTAFEKKMANVITLTVIAVITIIAATCSIALFQVINMAEFGVGTKIAVWGKLKPFAWVLLAEVVIGIVIGRRVAVIEAKTLAGPIARISDYLKNVIDGNKTDLLCVREDDVLAVLIERINRLVAKASGR